MSGPRPRGRDGRERSASTSGKAGRAGASSIANTFVALLERRGRFLTAEPLFPQRDRAAGPSRGRPSTRVTLGPAGSAGRARVHVAAGEMALVQASSRGAGARVVRALGRPDVARDVIEALLLDRGLPRGFDAAVEREAKDAGERVRRSCAGVAAGASEGARTGAGEGTDASAGEGTGEGAGTGEGTGAGEGTDASAGAATATGARRRDLRDLATFTIDPASARDFDDAISAEAIDGGVRVWVHIADVAAHVPEGSLVDREARRRATSVYAPGAVEPMLPHALSSDACSLVPGEDRAAVTVELELHGASVVRAAFHRSLIRSDARLDYERVDRIFAGAERAAAPWGVPLAAAREAAAALQQERERGGALVVDSHEPEFAFDERGNVSEIIARAQTESHRLIEHLMIAANEAVARLLQQRGVPCLYRVHERPQPERVQRLADQLASLDVPTPALPEHMSSSQAAQLVGEMSRRVDAHVRRSGHGRQALSSLVLRSLMQAYYSPKNLGHAGLRSASYCHFTSPIRRYPDLVCHRALLSSVGAGEPAPRVGELAELGAWTSERERDAMIIERDADDVARCFALAQVLRDRGYEHQFAGEVVGLISAGAFIAFEQYEGMLPVRHLPGPSGREWWELNEHGTILYGERTGAALRLGDAITVRVARVDTIRGRVDLVPAT